MTIGLYHKKNSTYSNDNTHTNVAHCGLCWLGMPMHVGH